MGDFLVTLFQAIGEYSPIVAAVASVAALAMSNKTAKQVENIDIKLTSNDQAILRTKIKSLADVYIDRGYITSEELEDLDSLYDRYLACDGNSFIKKKMEIVNKLDVREHEKKESNMGCKGKKKK